MCLSVSLCLSSPLPPSALPLLLPLPPLPLASPPCSPRRPWLLRGARLRLAMCPLLPVARCVDNCASAPLLVRSPWVRLGRACTVWVLLPRSSFPWLKRSGVPMSILCHPPPPGIYPTTWDKQRAEYAQFRNRDGVSCFGTPHLQESRLRSRRHRGRHRQLGRPPPSHPLPSTRTVIRPRR